MIRMHPRRLQKRTFVHMTFREADTTKLARLDTTMSHKTGYTIFAHNDSWQVLLRNHQHKQFSITSAPSWPQVRKSSGSATPTPSRATGALSGECASGMRNGRKVCCGYEWAEFGVSGNASE